LLSRPRSSPRLLPPYHFWLDRLLFSCPLHLTRLPSFLFIPTATTEISTLSLHDALPIWLGIRLSNAWLEKVQVASISLHSACARDRKSTRLNSSHVSISYAVFCLKKKKLLQPPEELGNRPRVAAAAAQIRGDSRR